MGLLMDKLEAIPRLAECVEASRHAGPVRAEGARSGGRAPGSPIPPEVAAWDLLRDDEHGLLYLLHEACMAVHDELPHPRPDMPAFDWRDACAFLLREHLAWRTDPAVYGWVKDAVDAAWPPLAAWAGERLDRLTCPHCTGRVSKGHHSADGDALDLACEECGHIWGALDLAHALTAEQHLTVAELAEAHQMTERHARRLASVLQPVSGGASPHDPARYRRGDFEELRAKVRAA